MTSSLKNKLSEATSPYLRQHQDNPVAWQAWNEQTLVLARDSDKPILLSIGYSACHWCHVMAHESFADPETASLMNELFINIKVDREERPDLDKIYQLTHSLLNEGSPGGWPLTVFLSPYTQMPFFSGTYFPKRSRPGLLTFKEVCRRAADFYAEQGENIAQQATAISAALAELDMPRIMGVHTDLSYGLSYGPFDIARAQLHSSFDKTYGGFGAPPKFLHTTRLSLLLRHWYATRQQGAVDIRSESMLLHTLRNMAAGGIADQIGGGFYRYSTDDGWAIPHFEKMLYDNGLLLSLYSEVAMAFDDEGLRQVALDIARWAIQTLRSSTAGFYNALDADSSGEEGAYYLWAPDEVKAALNEEFYPVFAQRYGLDKPPNFEGRWHLVVAVDIEEIASSCSLEINEVDAQLQQARKQLLLSREQRVPPAIDNKQLVSWNALMTKGLADAGRYLNKSELVVVAQQSIDFIRTTLWDGKNLYGGFTQGQISSEAYLDDYAFLIDALLSSQQARWRRVDLDFAIDLANAMLEQFADKEKGGFYFTAHQQQKLIHRSKDYADEAIPAGNGVAAKALTRLGYLIGETRYIDAAMNTIKAAWAAIQSMPSAHCSLLLALDEVLTPPEILVLRVADDVVDEWAHAPSYTPRQLRIVIPNSESELPGVLNSLTSKGLFAAYRCRHGCYEFAVTDPAEFANY